jgi:peptidoglycan/LPS O-acetylase OafA/YrhL
MIRPFSIQAATHDGASSGPKYRRDIDGLRAIAVLSVVGFHAFPRWIRSGFIGVDIFFVISGFLISTIIFSGVERGDFSFVEFYGRRIRRIFPALIAVLVAAFGFAWFFLFADEYKQLGKQMAGGAGFVANLMFLYENSYFDVNIMLKPLVHLWSLGIEEQYYILWPVLIWASSKSRFNLLTLTMTLAVVSFFLGVREVDHDAVAAFYAPQTRFWELLTGSALAYAALHGPRLRAAARLGLGRYPAVETWWDKTKPNPLLLRECMSILGFGILAWAILFTDEHNFPGWAALPTVAGALLVIAAGGQAWINRVILSSTVMVWVGLISFPLYLWHWPLL